jgi:hypothetical protein
VPLAPPSTVEASQPGEQAEAGDVPRTRLLAYGLAVAIVGTLLLVVSTPAPWSLLATRADGYEASVEVLADGGPPLLGYADEEAEEYVPLGVTDDQGAYVLIPLVAHVLGLDDATTALEVVFLAAVFLTLLAYPLVFYTLFRSAAAAVVAPLVLLAGARLLYYQDVYWVPALAALALLPPLLLIDRRWPRWSFPAMLGLLVVASVASSLRSNAGLGVAIAAGIVVLGRPWSIPRKGLAAAALAVAYLSFSVLGMTAIREYRDSWVGDPAFAEGVAASHPVWHTAYIGLGYVPNDYGLRYRDEDAIETVELIEPGTPYLSEEYEEILRERYVDIATGNPDFFLSVTAQKLLVAIGNAAPLLVLLALLLPFALAVRRRLTVRLLLLALPTVLVASIQPIFAVPFQVYEAGLYGALGVVVLVLIAWLAAEAERRRGVRDLWGTASPRALRAGLAVAALAVLIFLARIPVDDRATEWQAGAPGAGESDVSLEER